MTAQGYGNHLKWNEEAKLKADLMNVKSRWRVPLALVGDLDHGVPLGSASHCFRLSGVPGIRVSSSSASPFPVPGCVIGHRGELPAT